MTFERCRFVGTELYGSVHQSSAFASCTFDRAALHGATLTGCRLTGSTFTDCRLVPLTIRDCDLTLVVAWPARSCAGTDLSGLRLREANLVGANLSGCDLRGADLTGARAERLDLTGADLRGARVDAGLWVGARWPAPSSTSSRPCCSPPRTASSSSRPPDSAPDRRGSAPPRADHRRRCGTGGTKVDQFVRAPPDGRSAAAPERRPSKDQGGSVSGWHHDPS